MGGGGARCRAVLLTGSPLLCGIAENVLACLPWAGGLGSPLALPPARVAGGLLGGGTGSGRCGGMFTLGSCAE